MRGSSNSARLATSTDRRGRPMADWLKVALGSALLTLLALL